MSTIQDKIDGLIALMRNAASYPNEKTQARKALERLCAKHSLNIEDVLREEQRIESYSVQCRNKNEADVFAQCVFRYAEPAEGRVGTSFRGANRIVFCCTPRKYVELMAAWSVLKIVWREEQETFKLAFFGANGLFGQRKKDAPEPDITEEEARRLARAGAMATFVKSAQIHKQLASGKQ